MKVYLTLLLLPLFGCSIYTASPTEYQFPYSTRNNNGCKILKDTVVLYAIFVDSKLTHPWTQYDLNSTLDSINKAARWLERQARENGQSLHIKVEHPTFANGKIPIKGELYRRPFSGLLQDKGIEYVNKWADRVAMKAHQTLPSEQPSEVTTLNKPKNRERLIARLRDIHQTESVALMFFVNNYYQKEISATFYSGAKNSTNPMEYAVISFKEPGTIAHEFIHLFGGIDLYRWQNRKYLDEYFSDALMAFPNQSTSSLSLSLVTQYLVGWNNELDMCNSLILNDLAYPSYYRKRRWLWKKG